MRRAGVNARQKPILLIGAGRMGSALLKGWTQKKIARIEIVEPDPPPALKALAKSAHAKLHRDLPSIVPAACLVALKPQVLKTEAAALRPIANSGALMISIAAGTSIKSLTKAWGPKVRIVRAMPNIPGAIGRGITALYASPRCSAKDRALAENLLSALGETVWLKRETLIDAATAVSGSGPAYVFLLAEAMTEAAEAEGLPRDAAEKLARATIAGAGALLDADKRDAAQLRRDVTSPGGTTEAALKILMAKGGFNALMSRAIAAARKRAEELSK
jgi:pyrroline-5-carboxylate reductase